MANSLFYAVSSVVPVELARTMGAERLAQFCPHHRALADNVVSRAGARIFSAGDGLAQADAAFVAALRKQVPVS